MRHDYMCGKNINIYDIEISADKTYHIYMGKPLYDKRFTSVQSYHYPGIAAVMDGTGAYHIDICGNPIYSQRYVKTYGYYEGIATVVDDKGYMHIDLDGKAIHDKHFAWAGNFQNGACVVRDWDGTYYHIDKKGRPLYKERYAYAGDFRHGVAVVYDFDGYAYHINKKGEKVHDNKFLELYPYHKGVAVARDIHGYFHIDEQGRSLYEKRFRYVEDFYNDYALAWEYNGSMVIIDRHGNIVHRVTNSNSKAVELVSRKILMDMLVGYWNTMILNSIVKLEILDYIDKGYNTLDNLATKLGLKYHCIKIIIDYLKVKGFIYIENNKIILSQLGKILLENNKHTLKYAALLWGDEHYIVLHKLYDALVTCKEQFSRIYGIKYYDYLKKHPDKYKIFIRAMAEYADDYDELISKMNIPLNVKRIIDIGGASGVLLQKILNRYKHIREGIVFDQPEVINNIVEDRRIRFVGGDFLVKIPILNADAAILSRVLHDWPDKEALTILCNTNKALSYKGYLYIFELIKPEDPQYDLGVSLEFNLLAMLGSKERTLNEYRTLLEETGFAIKRVVRGNVVSLIEAIKIKDCELASR